MAVIKIMTKAGFVKLLKPVMELIKGKAEANHTHPHYRAYNYTNGCLVQLDVAATSAAMIFIHIMGNSYNSNDVPYNTLVQFYNYPDSNDIIQASAVDCGASFGNIEAFNYNGKIYIWFKQPSTFKSFIVSAYHTNGGTAVPVTLQITNAAVPTSGVTRKKSISPKSVALTTSNVATATKLNTARTLTIGSTGKPFDGSANATWTLAEIGAAAASHTHSNYLTAITKAQVENVLTGAITSHTHNYAAASHTHNYAGSSSAGGAATSATKLTTARTLTIGNSGKTFDGSANATWTLADIGAAATNHTHNYAPLGANTVTAITAVPVDKPLVIATISAAASFKLASAPTAGREVHIMVKNSGTADITITLPTTGGYWSDSDSLTISAGSYGEINAISDGTTIYLRSI